MNTMCMAKRFVFGLALSASVLLAHASQVPVTDGLALWLDASQLTGVADGAQVETWTDMSGLGNNAIRQGGSSAGNPQYKVNQLNGQPVVRFNFNAGDNQIGDHFRFSRITTIRTVFWVLKENAGQADGHFLLGDQSSYDFHRESANGPLWQGTYASGYIMGGTTKLMGTVINGTSTSLPAGSFQLLSLITTGNVNADQVTQDRVYHGSWYGDIAEILIYTRALTGEEELAVGGYLAGKYGLDTAYFPPAPSALTAAAVPGPQINLEWVDNANNELGFKIERKLGPEGSYEQVGTVGANVTSYQDQDAGLAVGSTYIYRVRAYSDAGESPYSTEASATIQVISNAGGASSVAGNAACLNGTLIATGTLSSVVGVCWGSAEGGTDAAAWAGQASFVPYTGTELPVAYSTNVTGLAEGTVYHYRYYMVDGLETNWALASVSFKTLGMPAVDNAGGATAAGPTSATLNGTLTNGGSAHIYVLWGTADAGDSLAGWEHTEELGERAEGPFSVSVSLSPAQDYFYRCYATNLVGEAFAAASSTFMSGNPVLCVDQAATGANNGLNWADAFVNLQSALDQANTMTNQIWVAQGTYNVANSSGSTYLITNAPNILVYGGFTNGMTGLADRDWIAHPTIMKSPDSAHRILYVTATDVTIDGFAIRDASQDGKGHGSAVNSTGNGLRLVNCNITNNRNCSPCTAVFAANSSLTLDGCTIANSGAQFWQRDIGGAVVVKSGVLLATNCLFKSNSAISDFWHVGGGAIALQDSAGTLVNCIFSGNTENDNGAGGAIYSQRSTLTANNCTFYANKAGLGGTIYVKESGACTVRNSIFWGNVGTPLDIASELGTTLTLDHCSFSGLGSGNIVAGGAGTLSHCFAADPQFYDTTYFRLKSTVGRWDDAASAWATDAASSACIDAGTPASDYSRESAPNGGRINLGWDGNMAYASQSEATAAPTVVSLPPEVYNTTARLKGQLSSGSPAEITIYYGSTDGGTPPGTWDHSVTISPWAQVGTPFSVLVGDLTPSSTYWFRCTAANAAGYASGSLDSFNTGTMPAGGGAGVVHVNQAATNGVQSGLNWQDAYLYLSAGINAATDEIWVAKGTYAEGMRIATLAQANLKMYGGFDGTETTRAARDWTNNPAIIDGKKQVALIKVTGANVTIDGFSMLNARCDHERINAPPIKNEGKGLTLANCTVANSVSWDDFLNGTLYSTAGLTLLNCNFSTNLLDTMYNAQGGVVHFNSSDDLVVSNCCFLNNRIGKDDDSNRGGAIYKAGSGRMIIKNTVFANNSMGTGGGTTGGGGAIYVASGAGQIENCTFFTNQVTAGSGGGGAIRLDNARLLVKNSIFWQNTTLSATGNDIYVGSGGSLTNSYNCFTSTAAPAGVYEAVEGSVTWLAGNITADPLFGLTSAYDVHLKGTGGRWNPLTASWTNDLVDSPCVDAGDPMSAYALEPAHSNNKRVNMGAYGNTSRASYLSPTPKGTIIIIL